MEWKRRAGEPARWYGRFEVYRDLGPRRTLKDAYRQVAQAEGLRSPYPNAAWHKQAEKWQWVERAQAWDDAQRERLQGEEGKRRFEAREYRLAMIDELLEIVYTLLVEVEMPALDSEMAHKWLPSLRMLFRDLLAAHRTELGLPLWTGEAGEGEIPPLSADELAQARAELEEWRSAAASEQDAVRASTETSTTDFAALKPPNGFVALRNVLARLYPDESSARRIADQAGLDRSHIDFGGLAINNWHAILSEAEQSGGVATLIAVVRDEYGGSMELQHALGHFDIGNGVQ